MHRDARLQREKSALADEDLGQTAREILVEREADAPRAEGGRVATSPRAAP